MLIPTVDQISASLWSVSLEMPYRGEHAECPEDPHEQRRHGG